MRLFLNASQVAKLLGVDRATVIRWIRRGSVPGARRSTRGRKDWNIPLASYQALAKEKGYVVNAKV